MFSYLNKVVRSKVRNGLSRPFLTLVLLFGSVSVLIADEPCRTLLPERLQTPAIIQKAEQVSGILDELAKSRERFLASGDLIEIFPALYYHATVAQFREAVTHEPPMAEAFLDLIIAFYDAYLSNRQRFDGAGTKAVEPHWRLYYGRAIERNLSKSVDTPAVLAILLYGIDAHLIDLARSIRYSLGRGTVPTEKFREMYFKLDPLFYPVAEAVSKDMTAARQIDPQLMKFESAFGLGPRYVIQARNRSWNEATARGPLRAAAAQPVLPRSKGTRTFFTMEKTEACQ